MAVCREGRLHQINMLENGTYTYTFPGPPRLAIQLVLERASKLEMHAYVDRAIDGKGDVRLFLSLNTQSVKFTDLFGNGPGTCCHRAGLGTLLVNTAVQALKQLYPLTATVHGYVWESNVGGLPESARRTRQVERKLFWRTFGFGFTAPDHRGGVHLRGTVGKLRDGKSGKVLGVHPRAIDLSHMQFCQTAAPCVLLRYRPYIGI